MIRQYMQSSAAEPAAVAVVGAGDYGTGLICQLGSIPDLRAAMVVDRDRDQIRSALQRARVPADQIKEVHSAADVRRTIESGLTAVTGSMDLIPEAPIAVVADCTGSVEAGARLAYYSLLAKKHVVEVNVEMDVLFGPFLGELARSMGVVYTAADGDQPSLAASLVYWARSIGLEIIMVGKGTSLYSEAEAAARLTPATSWSTHAYLDGSKSQIEMAAVANMTGLEIDKTGFHKPTASAEQALELFAADTEEGILSRAGVVDFVNCRGSSEENLDPRLSAGVFVIVTSDNESALELMKSKGALVSRDGRRVLIYRSHHLCGIETPWSVLEAIHFGRATGAPLARPLAVVAAVAKTDLDAGTTLDGLGGRTVKGTAVPFNNAADLLPIGLADHVVLNQSVPKGQTISFSDLAAPGDGWAWHLYALQRDAINRLEGGQGRGTI